MHGVKSHTGANEMIITQPGVQPGTHLRNLVRCIFLPAEALLAHGTVKALNESLLILAVRTGDAMLVGIVRNLVDEIFLKLRTAIGLDNLTRVQSKPSTLQARQHHPQPSV